MLLYVTIVLAFSIIIPKCSCFSRLSFSQVQNVQNVQKEKVSCRQSDRRLSHAFFLKDEKDLIKLRCTNEENEVCHREDFLCCFGGNDLVIMDNCNIIYESYS